MEQYKKWIREGMNLWIFIEVWRKVHLILGGWQVCGKTSPTLLSIQLGPDPRPLSKKPTLMSLTPRTLHKQIYIEMWYQKDYLKHFYWHFARCEKATGFFDMLFKSPSNSTLFYLKKNSLEKLIWKWKPLTRTTNCFMIT